MKKQTEMGEDITKNNEESKELFTSVTKTIDFLNLKGTDMKMNFYFFYFDIFRTK